MKRFNAPSSKAVILAMTVEIGDGRQDIIEIAEDDEPDMLAKLFCKKHNLPRDFIDVLASQIEANIDKTLEDDYSLEAEDWTFADSEKEEGHISQHSRGYSDMPSEISQSETLQAQFQSLAGENSHTSQASSRGSVASAGERLYYLGVMKKEKSKKWREQQVLKHDEMTSKDLTFKPAINSRSRSLAKNHRRAEECYVDQQRKKLESIERKKGESLAGQQTECTFVPKVNPLSQAIVRSKSTQRNAFVNLYSEAQDRQQRLQEAKDNITRAQCPFRPSINTSQRFRSVSRERGVVERLTNSHVMAESNLQRIREKQTALVDTKTGQAFFKPKICRAPRQDRNSENLPIGVYLFSHSRESSKLLEPSTSIELLSRPRSTQIIERLKQERFKQLFEMLNPDENDEIVSYGVEPEKLSAELLTVMFPLLEELEQLGEPINFAEFCEAMDNLLLTLTPGDKSMILVPRRSRPDAEYFSHQPQINEFFPKSYRQKQLAKLPLYDRMNYLTIEKKQRIEEAKTRGEQAELDQCTFHPKIKAYRLPEESVDEPDPYFIVRPLLR